MIVYRNAMIAIVAVISSMLWIAVANAALVTLDSPNGNTFSQGETLSVDLVGRDFTDGVLDGGGVNLNFDPNIVRVVSVAVDATIWEFFRQDGAIDNTAGEVVGIAFGSFAARTGDLVFASVVFQAVGVGTTAVQLSEYATNPFASNGAGYPNVAFDSSVSLTSNPVPVPAPAAIMLLPFGLGILRRRKAT